MKLKGFTLVEILVVAVIIGILAATAIPAYTNYIRKASDQVCEHTAAMVLTTVLAFIQDQDPLLNQLTPGVHRDIDELNAILGKFRIVIPPDFTIDLVVTDTDHIYVLIQDGVYNGYAEIGE